MGARAILSALFFGLAVPAAADQFSSDGFPEFGPEALSLVEATEALFDALEAESADAAKPAPSLKLRRATPDPVSFDIPAAGRAALRPEIGAIADLTGYQITWYPTESLSGTVDFVGTWKNGRNLVCGYVTWDMTDPTAPALAAMTTAYLDTRALAGLSADAAHAELLRANCAFGEIEPNLALARDLG